MAKKTDKQILFERMNKVAGMPLNENNSMLDSSVNTYAGKYKEKFNKLISKLPISDTINGENISETINTKQIAKILNVSTSIAYNIMNDLLKHNISFKYGYKTSGGWEDPEHSNLNTNSLYWQIYLPAK